MVAEFNQHTDRKNEVIKSLDLHKLCKGQVYAENASKPFVLPFTISLDFLDIHMLGKAPEVLEKNSKFIGEKETIYQIDDDLTLILQDFSGGHFKNVFDCYLFGEKVARLQSAPHNTKIFNAESVMLHIENEQLYTDSWYNSYELIRQKLNLVFKNFTRVDIAIDGLNYIPKFLNYYAKQTEKRKKVEMKGRARFAAGVLDKKTMEFQHFKIGSNKGDKYITIYNKSKELEKSNKMYIRKFWEVNNVDPQSDVFRFEMRMTNNAMKSIVGVDVNALQTPKYLMMLLKTQCKNFFEFAFKRGTNVTRMQTIDLLGFTNPEISYLDKAKRGLTDGRYKAKLSIKLSIKDICTGNYRTLEAAKSSFETVKENLELYDLKEWYSYRLPDWINEFKARNGRTSVIFNELLN